MARLAAFRAESDDGPDVLRWLDRMLIRLVPSSSFSIHYSIVFDVSILKLIIAFIDISYNFNN